METLQNLLGIGLEPKDLTILQVSLRGIFVFIVSLIIVRLGDKRFMSRKTAFDAVLGFILASMLARTINGSSPLIPSLVGALVIVLLHRLLAVLAFRSHFIGILVKGRESLMVEDGRVLENELRKNSISERDLLEDLRSNGNVAEPSEVKMARLERSGHISVVRRKNE